MAIFEPEAAISNDGEQSKGAARIAERAVGNNRKKPATKGATKT
jgi:hypothetical protein